MLDTVSELALKIQKATSKAESDALFSQLEQETCAFRSDIIRRVYLKGVEAVDINAIILEGTWRAVQLFNPDIGPFLPLAATISWRRIVTFLHSEKAFTRRVLAKSLSLDLPVVATGRASNLREIVPDNYSHNQLDSVIAKEQMALLLNELSKYETQVVFLLSEGRTYDEIAEQLDSDRKSIDNALCRARRKAVAFFPERTDSKIQSKLWNEQADKAIGELDKQKVPNTEIAKILKAAPSVVSCRKGIQRAQARIKKSRRGVK